MTERSAPVRGNILVVDDTPANLALMASVLKEKGHRVRTVSSGALALKAAEVEVPDLILLDIRMPRIDGFEVCRRLKESERLRGVPVIFLTALSDTADKVRAFSMGGVDYVTKPFQIEELEARVETHLSLRRLHLQLEENYARVKGLEQMREKLIQMIAHDLQSSIAAASFSAAFVRQSAGLQGQALAAIDGVVSACEVLNRMTLDMLDVARNDTGSLAPRLEALDLRGLVDSVLVRARGAARASGKSVVAAFAPDVPTVVADRELLRRIVENLLDNALKYAPPDSEVRVEVALAGDGLYSIQLRDQGPGVPPTARERIFDPYVRLEPGTARHARSSRGLGLAFCQLAAEAHGGRIWVEDNLPVGSTFVLELPIDPAAVATAAATGRPSPVRRQRSRACVKD